VSNYNFDHPDAFDRDALLECILELRAGRSVEVPVYDFVTHSRKTDEVTPRGASAGWGLGRLFTAAAGG
jgi:uridine kinase